VRLKVLDLFSGIGGFSLGLERAGMETVAFCENDEACRLVLKKHWPQIPIFPDIIKLKKKHLPEIDVICGGFPCQDVSVAGSKKGFLHGNKRTRSGLWEEYKRLIKEIKPRYAIIENVANLRNLGLNKVIKDLGSVGYACEWHIISARAIGANHLRERVWIIAYPDGNAVSQQSRGSSGQSRENSLQSRATSKEKRAQSSDSNMPRLWRPFASEEKKSEWWAKASTGFHDWWEAESNICRVDDGLPRKLDKNRKERIKQLGNSLLPQIPELIGRELLLWEAQYGLR
jgi:DNA (cytosine-5)-methyltransferase 1